MDRDATLDYPNTTPRVGLVPPSPCCIRTDCPTPSDCPGKACDLYVPGLTDAEVAKLVTFQRWSNALVLDTFRTGRGPFRPLAAGARLAGRALS